MYATSAALLLLGVAIKQAMGQRMEGGGGKKEKGGERAEEEGERRSAVALWEGEGGGSRRRDTARCSTPS
jgi:hypothetical protein